MSEKIYYKDDYTCLMKGDVLDCLKNLPDNYVQCVVTSPPYWGLRDYGVDGQLGLEETPEAYVERMAEVFREVRRVLRDDGTLWLNLGDSYSGGKVGRDDKNDGGGLYDGRQKGWTGTETRQRPVPSGLKPKDLVGIPWRVAFALQRDGWWLRSDVIWHKSNPMPESVTDRPTSSHEHIFLLAKSRRYYYDHEAIKEDATHAGIDRDIRVGEKRNKRDVWTVTTKPFPDAHFAVYPPDLIVPCIKAGSAKGDLVLDPFSGAGTTGLVAKKLGMKYIGIDLGAKYHDMAIKRIQDVEIGEGFEEKKPLPDDAKFLTSIDGIGENKAWDIWNHFDGNIYEIVTAGNELKKVDGIGDKTIRQIKKGLGIDNQNHMLLPGLDLEEKN